MVELVAAVGLDVHELVKHVRGGHGKSEHDQDRGGGLVGGASLKAEEFARIVKFETPQAARALAMSASARCFAAASCLACSAASCGVTPHAQNTGISSFIISTGSP